MVSASVYRWGTCFDRVITNGLGIVLARKNVPGFCCSAQRIRWGFLLLGTPGPP